MSFYQYFSAKDDVYYRLAVQVSQQVHASLEALDPLTPDGPGRESMRAWVGREADIYQHYGPIFNAFGAIAAVTEAVADLGAKTGRDNVAWIRASLVGVALPPRQADAVVALLSGSIARTFHLAEVLGSAAPEAYPIPRIADALADVLHRSFFGYAAGINVHDASGSAVPPPHLAFSAETRDLLAGGTSHAMSPAQPALEALLAAGREAFTSRGFHGTRVDDVAAAAGLSHGAFYQYFTNKGALAHALIMSAMRPLATAFADLPVPGIDGGFQTAELRRWLRRYNASHVHEAAIIRVWVDAQSEEAPIAADAAPALDWARRRLAAFLRPRGFGDVDAEAVVMVALLDTFGSQRRSSETIDAVAYIIRRGLLGQ